MAKIAEAFVEIKARNQNLKRGLRDSVKQTRRSVAVMNNTLAKLGLAGAGAAIGAGAIRKLKAFIKGNTEAFLEQRKAVDSLTAALDSTGQSVAKNLPMLKRQASAIQAVTTIGDEQTLQLQASAIALGANAKEASAVSRAAIGLATKLKRTVNPQLLQYVVLAQQGEFTMLQRYIPALRSATSAQEKFAIFQKFVNEGFEQQKVLAQTQLGGLQRLSNSFGDVREQLGRLVVESNTAQSKRGIFGLSLVFDAINNELGKMPSLLDVATTGIQQMAAALGQNRILGPGIRAIGAGIGGRIVGSARGDQAAIQRRVNEITEAIGRNERELAGGVGGDSPSDRRRRTHQLTNANRRMRKDLDLLQEQLLQMRTPDSPTAPAAARTSFIQARLSDVALGGLIRKAKVTTDKPADRKQQTQILKEIQRLNQRFNQPFEFQWE
jgi:hypothetical protein